MKYTKEALLQMKYMMEEWIEYRGGMGNRIDGFMVIDRIKNELKEFDDEKYGNKYHKLCKICGLCITCGYCKRWGCGREVEDGE